MMKIAKIVFGLVFSLLALALTWSCWRFPVYNERQVENTIERNIPTGTSQPQVVKFLNTLKKQDVYYEASSGGAVAYFPETMFSMRGWRCVAVAFTFKNGKMSDYEIKRVSI